MATVRELIAKFGFDIDTKPLDEFNDAFDKTKKAVSAFAVTKVLQAASNIASEFQVATRQIALMGGELEALNIVNNLNRIVTSSKDAMVAVRNAIEATSDPKFISKIAQDAENLAAITGESFDSILGRISAFVDGSNEAMVALGLMDRKEIESLEAQGIVMKRATRQNIAINRLTAARLRNSKLLLRSQEDLDVQVSRTGKIFSDFAKFIGDIINPVLAGMLELFNDIAEFFINSKVGMFAGAVLFLGGAFKTLFSAARILMPVLRIIGSAVAGLFNIFTAAGAAIAAMGVFIHDLWAAFNDPMSAILFTEKGSDNFSKWVRDIKAMGEGFDTLNGLIADFFSAGGELVVDLVGSFSDMVSGGVRSLVGDPLPPQSGGGEKTATININADTVEAGQAAGKEAGNQMKQLGISVNETTMTQVRARKAIKAGGQ